MKKLVLMVLFGCVFCCGFVFGEIPKLIISEVYFAGTDEWIEIYNNDTQAFSGTITLSGVKSSNLILKSILIAPNDAVLLGDTMAMIQDKSKVIGLNLGLSILDTVPVNIKLLRSGIIIDSLYGDLALVNTTKTKKSSIQKIKSDSQFIITGVLFESGWNVIPGFLANPGKLISRDTYSGNINTGTVSTGGTFTGINQSGIDITGIVCNNFGDIVQISEIYPGSINYPPYIELNGISDFSGKLYLSGSLLKEPVTLDISIKKGQYVLISRSDNGWLSTIDVVLNQAIYLHSTGGQVFLKGQSGQVLDNLYFSGANDAVSVYFDYQTGCSRSFSKRGNFTPGISEEYLKYFDSCKSIENTKEIIKEVTKEVIVEKIVYQDSCSSSSNNSTSSTGDNTTVSAIISGKIDIVNIDYNPEGSDTNRETVVLKSHLDYDLDLTNIRLHSYNRTTKNRIYGILKAGETQTFTGNYAFPNTNNCIDLLSGEFALDQFCYEVIEASTTTTTVTPILSLDKSIGTGQQDMNMYGQAKIKFTTIIFDPDGSDTDNEVIGLKMSSTQDLSIEDFDLSIDGRKNKLRYSELNTDPVLRQGEEKKIIGNFRLPNSRDVCMKLLYQNIVYDEYCYSPEKSKTSIETETGTDQAIYSGDSKIINKLTGFNFQIKITSVSPNPDGKDSGNEKIGLLYNCIDSINNQDSEFCEKSINLSSGYYLTINSKKKYLKGILKIGVEQELTGTFGLPNKASCVTIVNNGFVFDKLCYEKPKEGVIFYNTGSFLEEMSDLDISILDKVRLKRKGNNLCSFYEDNLLECKKIVYKKGGPVTIKTDIYKKYVSVLHDYLQSNWSILFSNSQIKQYSSLLKFAESQVKINKFYVTIDGESISVFDLNKLFDLRYNHTPAQGFKKELAKFVLGEKVLEKFWKIEREYVSF